MHSGSIWARLVSISSHRQQRKWYMRVIRCVTIVSREVFFSLRLCSLVSLISELKQSLRKQPKFCDATTGFPAKFRLRNELRNSILMTRHYPVLHLIGWSKFATWHDQWEARPRSGYLRLFLRRHFARRNQWWHPKNWVDWYSSHISILFFL